MYDIPIVINNFNRLTTTKKLVEDLTNIGYQNIHILDNNSTYAPLLDWYKTVSCFVHYLPNNLQSRALYHPDCLYKFIDNDWVVYTDSDLELNPHTPKNFIQQLINIAHKYKINKVGLALKISDLPSTAYSDYYKNWEEQFWKVLIEPEVYQAAIDTTFCILNPREPFQYEALRIGGNFTCKHIPWYTDFYNLTEEERYYLDTASNDSTYKRFYINQKTKY